MFPNLWVEKTVSTPSDMLTLVFGIHFKLFIVLPIPQKTCRSNVFFFFTKQNTCNHTSRSVANSRRKSCEWERLMVEVAITFKVYFHLIYIFFKVMLMSRMDGIKCFLEDYFIISFWFTYLYFVHAICLSVYVLQYLNRLSLYHNEF